MELVILTTKPDIVLKVQSPPFNGKVALKLTFFSILVFIRSLILQIILMLSAPYYSKANIVRDYDPN